MTNLKKQWRNARDYLKTTLDKRGIPCALSKDSATEMQCKIASPSAVGLAHTPYRLEFHINSENPVATLEQPSLFTATDASSMTFMHHNLKNYIDKDKDAVAKKRAKIEDMLEAQKGNHAVGLQEATSEFKWNASEEQKMFEVAGPPFAKHILMVFEQGRFDMSAQAFPFLGMSMIISALSGTSYIGIAPPDLVQSSGQDFSLWLQRAESSAFDQVVSFLLEPGDSCWVPFGHFPVILGMHSQEYLASQKKVRSRKGPVSEIREFSSVEILPCPDLNNSKAASSVIQRMKAEHLRTRAGWPSAIAKHEGIVQWFAALDAAMA